MCVFSSLCWVKCSSTAGYLFYCLKLKQCQKQIAGCVKKAGAQWSVWFFFLRQFWRVADPSGRQHGWHLQGQCPHLGQVSEPTCQLCTRVKSTKLWTEPESTYASFNNNQAWHLRKHKKKPTTKYVKPFVPSRLMREKIFFDKSWSYKFSYGV